MKGWKTIGFNIITGALLLLSQMGQDWGISPELIATISVVGNFLLRFFTTTPVGKKNV